MSRNRPNRVQEQLLVGNAIKNLDNVVQQLVNAYGGLYEGFTKVEKRDRDGQQEMLFYLAAVADALAVAFPDKFTNPDGTTVDIFKRFYEKRFNKPVPEAATEQAAKPPVMFQPLANGETLVISTVGPNANG